MKKEIIAIVAGVLCVFLFTLIALGVGSGVAGLKWVAALSLFIISISALIFVPIFIIIIYFIRNYKVKKNKVRIEGYKDSKLKSLSFFKIALIANAITLGTPLVLRFECIFSEQCIIISSNYLYAIPFWAVLTNIFAATYWFFTRKRSKQ